MNNERRFSVKSGLSTLDKDMTHSQAMRWGRRNMPADLKRAGFDCFVCQTDAEIHGGVWLRVSYGKKF